MSRGNTIFKRLSTYLALMVIMTVVLQSKEASVDASVAASTQTEIHSTFVTTEETDSTINPSPSVSPEPTSSPTPEPTATPTPDSPTLTPSSPEVTPTVEPTPEPTKVPFRSKTLEQMSTYDYVSNSITGISTEKVPVKTLQNDIKEYGTLYGTGMPFEEYKAAMEYQWEDVTQYDKKPVKISVDINKTLNYKTYVDTLKKLSRYEGVYLYIIGKSSEGRNLYAIEVDMESEDDKNVFMLTGQIHAREFAGGTFIVKQLVDLVQKAQTDEKTMELLKKNKYVAVPIVNVDGRETLINEPDQWKSGKELWKAYTNGTDGNRNFPGLQWGQLEKGKSIKWSVAKKPGYANYLGAYAGSNSETKAMMKWLYQYTVVEQAVFYLDYHQQGSVIYAGKPWQTKAQEQICLNLRTNVMAVLNKNSFRRKYCRVNDDSSYGLLGEGTSLTDYAVGLAVGSKFSPAYGFSAFTEGKKEYILMQVKDLDKSTIKVNEANKKFGALTLEIGYGSSYLGNSSYTRSLLASEYKKYNYGILLEALPKMVK